MLDCGPIKDRIKKAEHESALFGLCDVVALVAEVESLRAENERMRRVVEAARIAHEAGKDVAHGGSIDMAVAASKAFDSALAALSPTAGKETA